MRGDTAMYTPEAPACAAGPSLRHGPRPSPLSSWAGKHSCVCMCVFFFFFFVQNLHAEHPRPGEGWPGPNTIQEKKNRNIAIQVLASLKKGEKNHICVCHLFQLRWEKRTRFLSPPPPPPPPPRRVELTLKHQFLNTEPSQIARVFLFPFPFFFSF